MRTPSAQRLTYDEFLRLPDDGRRHELIDGAHYVTPSPATLHQRIVGRLYHALHGYLASERVGEVFVAPLDIVLSSTDVVVPDLFVVLREQAGIVRDAHIAGAPAIVVEVLSPGTRRRDLGLKRKLYERTGVREYWAIDPGGSHVSVHARGEGEALSLRRSLATGDTLGSPLLPGFELPVSRLFDGTR